MNSSTESEDHDDLVPSLPAADLTGRAPAAVPAGGPQGAVGRPDVPSVPPAIRAGYAVSVAAPMAAGVAPLRSPGPAVPAPVATAAPPADLAVRGLLPDPAGGWWRGEVAISDGRIAAVAAVGAVPARRCIDVGHSYLLPGMVDGHVHSLSHPGEGIAAATAAAAAGGVTAIVEMPFDQTGPINTTDRLARKQELVSQQAHVDVALLGTVTPGGGWRQVDGLRDGGVVGLKVSLFDTDPHRFPRIPDPELIDVFAAAAAAGVPVCVHAENNEIVTSLIGRLRPDGADPLAHCRSRPPISETLGALSVLETAHYTGARVHLCHSSLPRSVDLVRQYAAGGVDVTLESCPHYLLLDDGDMARQGTRLKINPPLRDAAAREGLWQRLVAGQLDVISSDHAPWPLEFKTRPNVFDNHSGAPGVETVYPLMLAEAHRRGQPAFHAAVAAMTVNPARRFGLDRRKGRLAPGWDADLVAFDPTVEWAVDETALHSNAGWSPYHGARVRGRIVLTLSRGRLVYDGELRSRPGQGILLAAGAAGPSDTAGAAGTSDTAG